MSTSTPANLVLEISTHNEEIDYIVKRLSEEWGKDVSSDGFSRWNKIAFESKVGQQDTNGGGLGLYYFILKDLNLKKGEDGSVIDQIVARCETLNRKALKIEPQGTEIKEIVTPTIGLVLTFPEFRKKGYAEVLIDEVYQFWQDGLPSVEESFIILFSGIGEYYSRVGFQSTEVSSHFIFSNENQFDVDDSKFEYLKFEAYEEVITKYATKVKADLLAKAKTSSKSIYTLLPTIETFNLIHEREILQGSSFINKDYQKDLQVGAMLDLDNFIIWSHNIPEKRIDILTIQYTSTTSFITLLKLAVNEAIKFGFTKIEIWDSSITKETRAEVLASIKEILPKSIFDNKNSILPSSELFSGKGKETYDWINIEPWTFF